MPPRLVKVEAPMRMADELERRFGVVTKPARDLALELLVPAIAADDQAAITSALNEIARRLAEVQESSLEADALATAEKVNNRNQKLFFDALGAAVGMKILGSDDGPEPAVSVAGALPVRPARKGTLIVRLSAQPDLLSAQFATANARLVKSLSAEVVPALRDEIVRAVQFGIDPDVAAARLSKKWAKSGVPVTTGNLDSRVRLIVRDQVARLNTDLTKARSEAAGITEFTWRSQRDDRVRELHREIDDGGQKYLFSVGHPTEGLPGFPPNCRCIAIPVVDRDTVVSSPGFINLTQVESFELALIAGP